MAEKGHLATLQRKQAFAVMDKIGPLLDAWEGIPYDVRGMPELHEFRKHMNKLYRAVDGDDAGLKRAGSTDSGEAKP